MPFMVRIYGHFKQTPELEIYLLKCLLSGSEKTADGME